MIGTDEWKQAGTVAAAVGNLWIDASNAFGAEFPATRLTAEDFIELYREKRVAALREDASAAAGAAEAESRGA